MVSIQKRKSHGQTYWYIVESRRVDGKPRPVTLAYLGKPETLLARLTSQQNFVLKSYSHGDTAALLNIAIELDLITFINQFVPPGPSQVKRQRHHLTVGASLLLAAIGRACQPTSKLGWYDWAQHTSLEYCLKSSFKKLDSQHFWDQMDALPAENIPLLEEAVVKKLVSTYQPQLDCLFYDATNFFTFIASTNGRCALPQRGKNKQRRIDLRQIGLALLVSRQEQFPLFHKTYRGNTADVTLFQDLFATMVDRLANLTDELHDLTVVFDKGNNSKSNFAMMDQQPDFYYVGGLVCEYFPKLMQQARGNLQTISLEQEKIPVYRTQTDIWGQARTCVVLVSQRLKAGQLRAIQQQLEKKCTVLEQFEQQLDSPKKRKKFDREAVSRRLKKIIKGQYVDQVLKFEIQDHSDGSSRFDYFVDQPAFDKLIEEDLGYRILVTNRHQWSTEEIIRAYRGQAKVEYAFRNLKNPFHCAFRPQYHWTDQKIEVHFFICILGYLLTIAAYHKARKQAGYQRNLHHFLNDLRSIRLASIIRSPPQGQGRLRVDFQLEEIPPDLQKVAEVLGITNQNLRPNIKLGVYK